MKAIFLPFLFFLFNGAFSQPNIDFVEIRVNAGPSIYGSTSIKLIREGLICRTYIMKKNEEKEIIKFFSFSELDKGKFIELQNYISENNIVNIGQLEVPDSIIVSHHNPIKISFIELNNNDFSTVLYQYCNPEMDNMIVLLNALIPKKYCSIFRIIPKCQNNN